MDRRGRNLSPLEAATSDDVLAPGIRLRNSALKQIRDAGVSMHVNLL
jgi:hypothetical protein